MHNSLCSSLDGLLSSTTFAVIWLAVFARGSGMHVFEHFASAELQELGWTYFRSAPSAGALFLERRAGLHVGPFPSV